MNNGSGVSRGDRNRNARLSRLRDAVPVVSAIVGIDLADKMQMVVVTDHDSKVLARRTFRCKAWELGAALDWAAERARAKGFMSVTVACEPTGHRWRVLNQLAAQRSMSFVCVQPAISSWVRRTEDLTTDKTDEKDAVLIARLTAQDWDHARGKLADTEARMVTVLDDLNLTELACSIEGLSPVGAAAILAETGDLSRYTSARAVVKHAGLAPRERMSGTFTGKARLSGAGRPGLRVAAWRAVWGCLQTNRVYAARYRHLTTRQTNKLAPTQAQTAVAAAILRQLHFVIVHRQAWDPVVAAHGTRRPMEVAAA